MALTALIVDDSPVMRTFIQRVMKLAGFDETTFLEACDGRDALDRLESQTVDVILTDINMPRMNGEEFLAELDKNKFTMPVLVISTDATRHRVDRMMALGAGGYISKPFTPEALRAELERVLGEPDAVRY